MNLPIEFEEKMQDLLGGEYNDYLKCYEEPRHYGPPCKYIQNINRSFLEIAPWPLRPIPWIENGFYYDGEKISACKAPVLFLRIVLFAGTKRNDACKQTPYRSRRPSA